MTKFIQKANNFICFENILCVLRYCQWAPMWSHSTVIIYTDDIFTCACIIKGPYLMNGLHLVFWLAVVYDLNITCKHIHVPGQQNIHADCASRIRVPGLLSRTVHIMELYSDLTPLWQSNFKVNIIFSATHVAKGLTSFLIAIVTPSTMIQNRTKLCNTTDLEPLQIPQNHVSYLIVGHIWNIAYKVGT